MRIDDLLNIKDIVINDLITCVCYYECRINVF